MLILSPTNYKPHPSNTKLINLHKIPNSSISLKPYENKTHHTLHLSYTPALSRKNSNFIPKLECSNFNLNLLKPTRHISLNYEKRDKYISQTKSFILKKIFREKQSQDHNLQFLSRNLEYENELYRGEEIHTEKQSPYSVALSLRNSCEKHNKTFKNKSPLTFKLTRIENFKISDRIKEVQLEEKEKENMGIYSSEISNNNHEEIKENNLEIDIENVKKFSI